MLAFRGAERPAAGTGLVLVDGVVRVRDGHASVNAALHLILRSHVDVQAIWLDHLRADEVVIVRPAMVRSTELHYRIEAWSLQRVALLIRQWLLILVLDSLEGLADLRLFAVVHLASRRDDCLYSLRWIAAAIGLQRVRLLEPSCDHSI